MIGGGVVGCAVARACALAGAHVMVLERSCDILAGASKGNSAILHTGFDAPAGSTEHELVRAGYRQYLAIHERLNLPILRTGALVLARSADDLDRLAELEQRALANGVHDVEIISPKAALRREPHLADIAGALLVPGESVIDPWSAPLAYLTHALACGAEVRFDADVLSGTFDGERWRLETSQGATCATYVINCAGLYGDILEERCLGKASFQIKPRKGQFVVFDKAAARYVSTIILPIPTKRSKGVVVTPTVFGNVLVGPTAEDQDERDRATVEQGALRELIATAARIVPALEGMPVTATFAGIRPATDRPEYRIVHDRKRHWLTLGGVRSTGLTASLGLADLALAELQLADQTDLDAVRWPHVPNLAEHLTRDWQRPGYDAIVCHCEMVTNREIDAAFTSPLPPRDVGGLRRRTRAGLGRCQGFYCGAKVASIVERHDTGESDRR